MRPNDNHARTNRLRTARAGATALAAAALLAVSACSSDGSGPALSAPDRPAESTPEGEPAPGSRGVEPNSYEIDATN